MSNVYERFEDGYADIDQFLIPVPDGWELVRPRVTNDAPIDRLLFFIEDQGNPIRYDVHNRHVAQTVAILDALEAIADQARLERERNIMT